MATDSVAAVLAALREEALDVAADQQSLADDLAAVIGGEAAVRRMQAFDLLRQRLELIAAVAEELAAGNAGLPERLLGRLTVSAVQARYARHLGLEAPEAGDDGGDVELF